MTNDPQNDSKSLGRNIFAENKAPLNTKKEEVKKAEDKPSDTKSIGRNMFSDPIKSENQAKEKSGEFNIIENKSPAAKKPPRKKKGKSSGKSKRINAIHISDNNVVFAQTFYDGLNYKLVNLQVSPIEFGQITEDNVFKTKEDPEIARRKLQLQAIDKVFKRAGVSKNDPMIVTSLDGRDVTVKEVFVKNTPEESIEFELPKLMQSPFEGFSQYEYIPLTSNGTDHRLLASIADNKAIMRIRSFFHTAGIECEVLDIDKIALINLYQESVDPPIGSIGCIIEIGEDFSHIIIVPNGNEELIIT